jgi:hypothetical protein
VSPFAQLEPADLTPSEIAHLVRYVRINVPWALVEVDKLFAGLDHVRGKRLRKNRTGQLQCQNTY